MAQVENSLQRKERPRSDSVPPSSGSIPIIFQGDVDEIDPQSATARSSPYIATKAPVPPQSIDDVGSRNFAPRFMEELRIKPPVNGPTKVSEQGGLQPEQSSSQLTDMLNGVSPSRADFRGYDSSSAVPSPLLRNPQSSMVPQQPDARAPEPDAGQAPSVFPAMPLPPRPRPGVPMHDHFFMTNEHIDVVAMSIFDWVKGCSDQTVKVAAFKNEQLKATIEKRFDDIKSQINSVGEKADHNGNQGHNVGVQLDKLRDFIKSEVVDVLALQAQKLKGVEKGIKELQKEMQDLQKSVAQSQTSTSTYPSPHQVCSPPCHYHHSFTDRRCRHPISSTHAHSPLSRPSTIQTSLPTVILLRCPPDHLDMDAMEAICKQAARLLVGTIGKVGRIVASRSPARAIPTILRALHLTTCTGLEDISNR